MEEGMEGRQQGNWMGNLREWSEEGGAQLSSAEWRRIRMNGDGLSMIGCTDGLLSY